MNKKIIIPILFAIMTSAVMAENNNEPDIEMMMMASDNRPMFFMPGPMMPQPPMFNMGGFFSQLDLTDEQREKLHNLSQKHFKGMKQIHDARAALQERYQEKFEAVLTDEQFRKIEKMRKDLRRDMKKLSDKQHDMFDQNRKALESILTDSQRQQLYKMRIDKKM